LGISGFTTGGSLSVTVSKTGYNISGSPKTATIYYYSGSSDTPVTFSTVTANGSASATTTTLTLTFSAAITGLSATDITLSGVSGVSKGTLSGSGPTYTLPISGFTAGGTLNVAVAKTGYTVSGSPKTVTIYYYSGGSGAWIDPATQTTQLTGGTVLLSYTSGNQNLSGSPYGYETWDFSEGGASTNTFTWYGVNQGGGGAFKATWTSYFLARLGYYWGNGGAYTQYNNIYVDYNFNRSNNASSPSGGFIGVYGWSRNPSASQDIEKLIEYYIVDDWFWDEQCGIQHIGGWDESANQCEELGSFEVDGATYKIYKNPRINEPSIDGTKTFIQIFSVRQGRRTQGTISVTEHFKAWSKYITLGSMYEAKFKVEAFGDWNDTVNGNLDLTYLYLSQEATRRNIPAGTTPVDYAGPSEHLEIQDPSFTGWGGLGGETGNSFAMVKEATNTYDCKITYEFPEGASAYSQFTVSYTITKTADTGNNAKLTLSDRAQDNWDNGAYTFEDYRDHDDGSGTYTHALGNNQFTIAINKYDESNPTADFTIVINSIRFHD
jgi:endo-1,4-beta-xylanase